MKKPLWALHKDSGGNVLGANSFTVSDEYGLGQWVRSLDIHNGDMIEFGVTAERPEFDEVEPAPQPALQPPVRPEPALVGDDQPL